MTGIEQGVLAPHEAAKFDPRAQRERMMQAAGISEEQIARNGTMPNTEKTGYTAVILDDTGTPRDAVPLPAELFQEGDKGVTPEKVDAIAAALGENQASPADGQVIEVVNYGEPTGPEVTAVIDPTDPYGFRAGKTENSNGEEAPLVSAA